MASYPQQKLMTDILKLTGFMVREYRFINEVGIVLLIENQQPFSNLSSMWFPHR